MTKLLVSGYYYLTLHTFCVISVLTSPLQRQLAPMQDMNAYAGIKL
jgi:hypothetical protein